MQTVDELVLRELVDVLLEGEIDRGPLVSNEALLLDRQDALRGHSLAEPGLDLGVLEVEEVARVVPGEAAPFDGLAVTADLGVRFEDEVVLVLGERARGEPTDPSADDEVTDGFHRLASLVNISKPAF